MISREFLVEAKGHLPHPEDDVFISSDSGARAIQSIEATAANPRTVTIKWDGYPALIFGRGPDGKFTIMDKHMFNKRDPAVRQLHSPEAWAQYEMARGDSARTGLVQIIQEIWPGLDQASSAAGPGYYWGDLLFRQPLQDKNGLYSFKANPNGISYTVDVDSDIGKLLTGKQAGIAVHQYLAPDASSTDDAVSLNGTIGKLQNNSDVAIVPSAMPVQPKIRIDKNALAKAKSSVGQLGPVVQKFLNDAPQARNSFEQLFTTYLNRRIVSGSLDNLVDGFYEYFKQRPMTDRMRANLTEYLRQNGKAVQAAFQIWIDIYNLKQSIIGDLDRAAASSPVKGYLQDGTQTQEGFVSNGYKFVNRMGFAKQNLAGRSKPVNEDANRVTKKLIIYPGGFHPFHLGHASVFNHLANKFADSDVFVAATDSKTERPFSFEQKSFLANQSGVPNGRFVQVSSPYKATEITSKYDPETTAIIFAISEKDRDRFKFQPKSDGSPGYFQPYRGGQLEPMSKHGYIYIVPTIDFKIAGKNVDSASKIRNMYASADDAGRARIISDLYPNARAPKRIKKILDSVLGGLMEADNRNYFGGSGTPRKLSKKTIELQKINEFKHLVDSGRVSIDEWITLLEQYHLNKQTLCESVNKDLRSFIENVSTLSNKQPVIGKKYIPLPIHIIGNNIFVYDCDGKSPPAAPPKKCKLIEKQDDFVIFEMSGREQTWPCDIYRDLSYFTCLCFDNYQDYEKAAVMLNLKLDITLPLSSKLSEADNPNYFGGSSVSAIPGTPPDLADPRSAREKRRDERRRAKLAAELRKWMGHKD